jgi:hypothetical protein
MTTDDFGNSTVLLQDDPADPTSWERRIRWCESLDDGELLAEMEHISGVLDHFKKTLGLLEQRAYQLMEERGATSIPSETYICEMETGFKYDQMSFGPLKEVFNEADLAKCLTPAHTEEVKVADKWATGTVKSLAVKYGAEALRILANARMESRGRLKFARRETR